MLFVKCSVGGCKGQLVCDECRMTRERQQQASQLIDLGIRLDRREE